VGIWNFTVYYNIKNMKFTKRNDKILILLSMYIVYTMNLFLRYLQKKKDRSNADRLLRLIKIR